MKKLLRGLRIQLAVAAALLAVLFPGPVGWGQEVVGQAGPPQPVVHAILFYSPTCPHCHQVINEDLIPLQEQYGERLVLLGFDTSQRWAYDLYFEAINFFDIPESRWAVPFMVVGDQVLIGGLEIPARFPSMIQDGLTGEGIDLPDIPGLVTFLREQGIIDPRYPERRIAVQTHSEDEAGASPDSAPPAEGQGEPVGGDTVPADSFGPPVGEVAQDSISGGVPAPPADSAEGREEAVAGGRVSGEEPGAVSDSTPPSPEDTVAASAADRPPRAGLSGLSPDSGSGATDAARSDSAGPAEGGGSDSPEAASPAQDSGTLRQDPASLDLQTAVRDLESIGMWDRFRLDPVGGGFSLLVLLILVCVLLLRGYPPRVRSAPWPGWMIPCLLAVGAAVALYLSYVEVTGIPAVCGPVGDCNTVQQSPYARLFGVLPVGVLGFAGYLVMFALWRLGIAGPPGWHQATQRLLWACALMGTLFSLYLTFLEPFIIGATCAWCLTSSLVMGLLLWGTAPLAARAWPSGQPRMRTIDP